MYPNRRRIPGRRYYCQDCRRYFEPDQPHNVFWCFIAFSMRNSALYRLRRGREQAGICTLDLEDMEAMYKRQNGRCYYSGLRMVQTRGSPWKASPERLDTEKGYIDGNVVLVCLEFNGFRQMSADRIHQMILDAQQTQHRIAKRVEVRRYWKHLYVRNQPRPRQFDFVYAYRAQGGRCAYSNIPLSLDVKDIYHQPAVEFHGNTTNFHLCIRALQVQRPGTWSKEKFEVLQNHLSRRHGTNILVPPPVYLRRSMRLLKQKKTKHDTEDDRDDDSDDDSENELKVEFEDI